MNSAFNLAVALSAIFGVCTCAFGQNYDFRSPSEQYAALRANGFQEHLRPCRHLVGSDVPVVAAKARLWLTILENLQEPRLWSDSTGMFSTTVAIIDFEFAGPSSSYLDLPEEVRITLQKKDGSRVSISDKKLSESNRSSV